MNPNIKFIIPVCSENIIKQVNRILLYVVVLWSLPSEPASLNQLVSLFIERNHSVWKIPEVVGILYPCIGLYCNLISQVLLWLERNARVVCARVDSQDPLVEEYKTWFALAFRLFRYC